MKSIKFKIMLIVVFGLITSTVLAQAPVPPGLPIDSGVTILLAVGVVYGINKLKEKTQ